jgi:DNA-binding CsgD family transcriptional regulator
VRKTRADLSEAIASAATLYGLTPAETRVLSAVIEAGGGVTSVALMLGLSRSTVKTHLEHLFAKTGARRQAALVKLIAGFDGSARHLKQK